MVSAIAHNLKSLNKHIKDYKKLNSKIVFVPTMGALHKGHIELAKKATKISPFTIVSIFINPLQFSKKEDLSSYTRDQEKDINLLQDLGVKIIYLPSAEDFYGKNFSTTVSIGEMGSILCGKSRPNHFNGVTTVITKLFFQIQPDIAIFGEKDFQQLQIIRKMISDLSIKCKLEAVPTVREKNGLAYSSRNINLTKKQRHIAPNLYKILKITSNKISAGNNIYKTCQNAIKSLLKAGFDEVDYFQAVDESTLYSIDTLKSQSRLLVAARLGNTRLIDNIKIQE